MLEYSEANKDDVPGIVDVRIKSIIASFVCSRGESVGRVDQEFAQYSERWLAYMNGEWNPQKATSERIVYKATNDGMIVGFIAGHLTTRLDCDGELQSIFILREWQRKGIGGELLKKLGHWFIENKVHRVCVNVAPENPYRVFYQKHGAEEINAHWLVWNNIRTTLK